MTPTKKTTPRIYGWNEPRIYPRPTTGRRALAFAAAGAQFTPAKADEAAPPRVERRRAWALVPRAVRESAPKPALDWLPPRARARLTKAITARNALDRALATARGMAADDPRCARFQGEHYRDALDKQVRANRRAGA